MFAKRPESLFAAGVTHDLVKIWPMKYWFRGQTFLSQVKPGAPGQAKEVWAAAGSTQAFQVAALPKMGAGNARFTLTVDAGALAVRVFRQAFVICPQARYPRFGSKRWPDPLVPESTATTSKLDLAAFWVDVAIPADHPGGTVVCKATLTGEVDGKTGKATFTVPLRVVPGLDLKPKQGMKLTSWFWPRWPDKRPMPPDVFTRMCEMSLDHHVQPTNVLEGVWDPKKPDAFDRKYRAFKDRGLGFFHLFKMTPDLYAHLVAKGMVAEFVTYGVDEPSRDMLIKSAIPRYRSLKKQYPKLAVYMATEPWPETGQVCDMFMTDLSSHLYDPRTYKHQAHPRLWHYYCHLPIRWQARAPLGMAPNMQIDNPAMEHRMAMWMSSHFGADGVFIYAGNSWGLAKDIWTTGRLGDKPYPFPYASVHNGNGFLVIQSPKLDGVYPTIRLKVLRAGMEDLALLRAAKRLLGAGKVKGAAAARLKALLNPVPGLFVHPHYFDRLPETLLGRREAILKQLAGAG